MITDEQGAEFIEKLTTRCSNRHGAYHAGLCLDCRKDLVKFMGLFVKATVLRLAIEDIERGPNAR